MKGEADTRMFHIVDSDSYAPKFVRSKETWNRYKNVSHCWQWFLRTEVNCSLEEVKFRSKSGNELSFCDYFKDEINARRACKWCYKQWGWTAFHFSARFSQRWHWWKTYCHHRPRYLLTLLKKDFDGIYEWKNLKKK